ncbi:HD-GYP domain-containing protein [Paenibacillus crassostreae]|uniref:HD family phosphohydrolase n=1 Tax=Paenibacillus crassostreae TaxID=1763538 RepID=A0A167G1V3_9BACL|nr:HD-GYP domain-containing protein [Paenibacillus crassostreae]AOZ93842.1 HD family phosphohydrolase [Paenibacillus crassostreae]OAB77124.1 HD family phosphohydrolase [Paenibacillus crassostreae]
MRVHVTDLKPGDILQADTFSAHGLHVLQKNTKLGPEEISKLLKHHVEFVEVELPIEVQPSKKEESLSKVKPHLAQAIDGFENIYLEALSTGKVNDTVVEDIMHPLVDQLVEQKDIVSLLLVLEQDDDYTYHHSMQVGMLSYYIATWLGYSKKESYLAGKAGYLHDIGKCRIPSDILNKPGKLTPEEFEIVKLHTTYGYEIIRDSSLDEVSALVALQHHERDDGTGYPLRVNKHNVHPFSQITAVADVFSAMTTHRVYQSKQALLTVLKEIYDLSFGKLNPKPTQALIRHMTPNFIGKNVVLSNGKSGKIIMNNNIDFFRPLVQIDDIFIDLSIESHLSIERILV